MSDKTKDIIVSICFIFILFIVMLINILKNDSLISISERRKLATFPSLTFESIKDGTFFSKFENYTMDQFLKREDFRTIKTYFELYILKKQDSNNIYSYNNHLVKQEYPLNEKSIANFTQKINTIQNKYLNTSNKVYYSIVPDKNYYVDDNTHLKINYSIIESTLANEFSNATYISIFNELTLDDYYYTDAHWKQENLEKILNKFSLTMSFNDRISSAFEKEKITDFSGVYSGQLPIKTNTDEINILTNDIINNCKVYNYEKKEYENIYNLNKITSSDKYDIYLSGATPLLTIENPNCKSNNELIVFRDSFGSSLIPLFTEAYKTITIIDTRYINPIILNNYVDFENKDVLFLYSISIINNSSTLK